MKKSTVFALVTAAVMAAVPLSAAHAKTYRAVFAGYFGPDHPNTAMMEKFKSELEEVSGGQFKIVLKPNNEAGGEVRSFRNDRKVAIAAGAPALLDLFFPLLANRPPQQGEHE